MIQIPDIIPQEEAIRKVRPGSLVYFDLERATGSEASEIIQIAYCCQGGRLQQF